MERENFYILLDLSIDPPETDAAVIEKQIRKKKAEWGKLRNHPTKGLQAQKNISLIPEIEKVMLDPKLRAEELEAAKAVLQKGKESKHPEIDRHIDILMGKGFISQEEVVKLARMHGSTHNEIQDRINKKKQEKFGHIDRAISLRMDKGYITEAEIAKIAKRHALSEEDVRSRVRCPIKKDDKAKSDVKPRHIDKSLEKTINDNLKILGKSSLYDFLDLPESAELESLQAQAVRKKKELASISRKDASITAGNTLAGHCMTIFKTDETRNAYDITLARSRLAALDSDIDIAAINGKVRYEYYDVLVQKAMEFGMDQQEADSYISSYCNRKGYKIEKTPGKHKKQLVFGAALAACLVMLIAAGLIFSNVREQKAQETEYRSLMTAVKEQPQLEKKQELLEQYLQSHPSNQYSDAVRKKIENISNELKKQAFAAVAEKAEQRKAAGQYTEAAGIYQEFIQDHPKSPYVSNAEKKAAELQALAEKKDFENLKKALINEDPDEKIAACQDFLKKYPESTHTDEINKFIREMSSEYFIFVKNRLDGCEENEDWKQCIRLCQTYIDLYDNSNADKLNLRLRKYKKRLRDQQVFARLKDKAAALEGDFAAAKQVYRDHLEAYPDTTIKEDIQEELAKLDERIDERRVRDAREKIRSALEDAGDRYAIQGEGIVLDQKTGLMWTMVDSRVTRPDECLTYDMAREYVNNLRTGGFSDWRLPTPDELAGIYKQKPFFPAEASRWYWSSKNYSRYSEGWQKIVDTVSGKHTTQWETVQRDAAECATVRAVREPE